MIQARLLRRNDDRRIAGVCAGLARRFKLDPTIVRVGWVVATVFTGFLPGIVLYALCAILIPEEEGE